MGGQIGGSTVGVKESGRPCSRQAANKTFCILELEQKLPGFYKPSETAVVYSFCRSLFFLEREASRRAQLIFELLFVVTELMRLEFDMYGYLHNVNL